MTQHDRLKRIAEALCMTPGPRLRLEQAKDKKWWLVGCVEGDQPLPRTQGIPTAPQALQAAEDWLAPELEPKESEKMTDPIQAEHDRRHREDVPAPDETNILVKPSVALQHAIDKGCFPSSSDDDDIADLEHQVRNLKERLEQTIECVGTMLDNLHPPVAISFRMGETFVTLEQKRDKMELTEEMVEKAQVTWKDTTSYRRDERGKVEPSEWTIEHGLLRVIVHRKFGLDGIWFFTCRALGLEDIDCGAVSLEQAKADAVRLSRVKARRLYEAAESLGEQS